MGLEEKNLQYDPETGRWTSKEPLGFAGSRNFYVYTEGDPVNFVDRTGLLYRCIRPLDIHVLGTFIFMNGGYHEYLCTKSGVCLGFTTGSFLISLLNKDVKSRWTTEEEDNLDSGICIEIQDDKCLDSCVENLLHEDPLFDYNLYSYNCQDHARDVYDYCTSMCGYYDMDSYDSIRF